MLGPSPRGATMLGAGVKAYSFTRKLKRAASRDHKNPADRTDHKNRADRTPPRDRRELLDASSSCTLAKFNERTAALRRELLQRDDDALSTFALCSDSSASAATENAASPRDTRKQERQMKRCGSATSGIAAVHSPRILHWHDSTSGGSGSGGGGGSGSKVSPSISNHSMDLDAFTRRTEALRRVLEADNFIMDAGITPAVLSRGADGSRGSRTSEEEGARTGAAGRSNFASSNVSEVAGDRLHMAGKAEELQSPLAMTQLDGDTPPGRPTRLAASPRAALATRPDSKSPQRHSDNATLEEEWARLEQAKGDLARERTSFELGLTVPVDARRAPYSTTAQSPTDSAEAVQTRAETEHRALQERRQSNPKTMEYYRLLEASSITPQNEKTALGKFHVTPARTNPAVRVPRTAVSAHVLGESVTRSKVRLTVSTPPRHRAPSASSKTALGQFHVAPARTSPAVRVSPTVVSAHTLGESDTHRKARSTVSTPARHRAPSTASTTPSETVRHQSGRTARYPSRSNSVAGQGATTPSIGRSVSCMESLVSEGLLDPGIYQSLLAGAIAGAKS